MAPLDHFTDAVKAEVLTRYVRTAEPRDGKFDYDVAGQAVGTWFVVGSNGYAGGETNDGKTEYWKMHLSLAYDYIDSAKLTLSIGDLGGQPTQFAILGDADWTKITAASGPVKVELAQRMYTADGKQWSGQFSTNIVMSPGPAKGTALIEMTGAETMKVEVFLGKTPAQVTGFTAAAKTYDRGQDAHMIQ
ncbi:MAG: hypothetical protein ABIQ73_22020 [Acidimicrobiales bacterium]